MRLDLLNTRETIMLIKETIQYAIKAKAAQLTGGDSIQFYQSDSGNFRDWSGVLPQSQQAPDTGFKALFVTATATKQEVLMSDLIIEMYVGSSTNRYDRKRQRQSYLTGPPTFDYRVYRVPLTYADRNKQRWLLTVSGDKTTTVWFKFYVVANDTVTIGVSDA